MSERENNDPVAECLECDRVGKIESGNRVGKSSRETCQSTRVGLPEEWPGSLAIVATRRAPRQSRLTSDRLRRSGHLRVRAVVNHTRRRLRAALQPLLGGPRPSRATVFETLLDSVASEFSPPRRGAVDHTERASTARCGRNWGGSVKTRPTTCLAVTITTGVRSVASSAGIGLIRHKRKSHRRARSPWHPCLVSSTCRHGIDRRQFTNLQLF